MKHAQISENLGIAKKTVCDVWRKFRDEGLTTIKPRSGAPSSFYRKPCSPCPKEAFNPLVKHLEIVTSTSSIHLLKQPEMP
ncbi:hypothetical protein BX666DRAFT_1992045 [Dichotomocladium elegans]|nr:hypothetical protein BX666DRAFT_1992045 [Dichotomocladium elegans]